MFSAAFAASHAVAHNYSALFRVTAGMMGKWAGFLPANQFLVCDGANLVEDARRGCGYPRDTRQ
jgi:hypothetical protein